jgi:large subunit ribosomal protein L21
MCLQLPLKTVRLDRRGYCGEVKIGGRLMKYAIVEDGGKQYKVIEDETIDVDRYSSEIGDQIDLDRVLLISDEDEVAVGKPFVEGANVQATVEEHFSGPKIIVFKYKPRIRYRVKTGHRQKYTRLRINSIKTE